MLRIHSEAARFELIERLTWQYGPERALAIMNGQDRRTNEDLARWRLLGLRAG